MKTENQIWGPTDKKYNKGFNRFIVNIKSIGREMPSALISQSNEGRVRGGGRTAQKPRQPKPTIVYL